MRRGGHASCGPSHPRISMLVLAFALTTTLGVLALAAVSRARDAGAGADSASADSSTAPVPEGYGTIESEGGGGTPGEVNGKVVVFYFHRTFRCQTCLWMEAAVSAAIAGHFPGAIEKGGLAWLPVDYEEPAGRAYADAYSLTGPTLVVSHRLDGEEVSWADVDEVWDFVDDSEGVEEVISGLLERCLSGDCEHMLVPAIRDASGPEGDPGERHSAGE